MVSLPSFSSRFFLTRIPSESQLFSLITMFNDDILQFHSEHMVSLWKICKAFDRKIKAFTNKQKFYLNYLALYGFYMHKNTKNNIMKNYGFCGTSSLVSCQFLSVILIANIRQEGFFFFFFWRKLWEITCFPIKPKSSDQWGIKNMYSPTVILKHHLLTIRTS